jgi:hypothetical protein
MYKGKLDIKINKHIFIIGVINALFVLLMFMFDGLRAQMLDILNYKEGAKKIAGTRSFDLSMGGSALASIVFSIIFIQGVLLKRHINKTLINIGLIIIFIATLLTGRTGLVIIIISLIICIIDAAFKINLSRFYRKNIKSMVVTSLTIVVLVMSFSYFMPENAKVRMQETILPWAFEFYYSYLENGDLDTHSTDVIFNKMYFLPNNSKDIIFGTSNMGRSDNLNYIPSDVGYIRIIFAVGIIGLALIFTPYIYLLYYGFKNRKGYLSSKMLVIASIVMFIANFKELVVLPRGGASILFIFFVSTMFNTYYNGNNKIDISK